jgi:hypothetical protein
MSLKDILNDRPSPEIINKPPKGFEQARVEVGNEKLEIVTVPQEVSVDAPAEATLDDCRDIIRQANLNPDAWTLVSYKTSKWEKSPGSWLTSTSLQAKPSGRSLGVTMPSLDAVVSSMKKFKPSKVSSLRSNENITVVGNIADPQIGKTDMRGGTEEFLIQNEESMYAWAQYVKRVAPEEVILGDLGDAFEGIENTAQQAFTNDLSMIDQMDVWSYVFWKWIELASTLAPSVKVVSVPSNHTALRRGKDYIGRPCDDYGLLIHRLLARQAKLAPEKFGHVQFFAPSEYEESLTIQAVGGKGVGFVHGHQFRQVHLADDWWADQTQGNGPLALADILNFGHHHHLTISEGRGGKFLFGNPALDPGSAWIRNLKGVDSKAGAMTYSLDKFGPYDWQIC